MYVLKGFVSHALLVQNILGVTAPIGELSTEALTYAREKGYHVKADVSDLTLTTFLSENSGTKVPADFEISVDYRVSDHVIDVAKFIYDQTIVGGGEVAADELLQDLLVTFETSAEDFNCGQIVNDGRYYMPEWVSWKHKTVEGGDNYVRIWFTDAGFRSQYDEFEIVVVPPFDQLDDFFRSSSDVQDLLSQITVSGTVDRLQQAKQNHPETIIRSETYDWVSPLNPAIRFPTNWGLLIYGQAGNNVDSIKDTLVEYILANSTHSRVDWTKVFPDIFKRTEFVLIPRWDRYAIPNRTLQVGIYSPISALTSTLELIKRVVVGYGGSHIDNHACVLGHPYKSLSVCAVGGPDNRDALFKITDVFPDYIDVSTTSLDFNRQTASTRGWSLKLMELILIAEEMGDFSDLPFGMTRVKRDGILYVVCSYENIHYLVAAKKNFPLV